MTDTYRVMLVEDSRTQALKLIDVFERAGWQVQWVASAEAAIEHLNRQTPDLIVLDYYLPRTRGDEVCRRVRMNIDTRGIPILMLTTEGSSDAELLGLDSGADDFVSKSVDTDILIARARTLLSKSSRASSILARADRHFQRVRILTIDDSITYQQYLAKELSGEGYEIEAAMCGRDGLERIMADRFGCALVDLVMPDMDGIELCRRVGEWRRSHDHAIGLLILTGQETKEDLTKALEAGADDFVGKSSDIAVLKSRIRALLRRKFVQEENRQIAERLKHKELEAFRARAAQDVAEAKAALNDELERRVLERTAQLAEANRNLAQKSQENEMFVYSVSHDLRSPLVNLQGFSGELVSACDELRTIFVENELPPAAKDRGLALLDGQIGECTRFIQTAVTRLSSIINALLRFSRIGRVEYQWQTVDVERVVARVIESMNATIAERGATVKLHALPPAWGDPTAIEQVFANLLGNAVRYLDPRRPGMIEVNSKGIQCAERDASTPRLNVYCVRDNGLGIPQDYLEKAFQMFQRLHPQVGEGEGIGLAIVRRIVDRHGGSVSVESVVGEGTAFFVTLPTVGEAQLVAGPAEPTEHAVPTGLCPVH